MNYYVTIYDEASKSGPEEGGYTDWGWEATLSKKFPTEELGRKYIQEFIDGADILEEDKTGFHIRDEWGDEYWINLETDKTRGRSHYAPRSWTEAEFDVPRKGPFFDDTGRRVGEDPKEVQARYEKERQQIKDFEATVSNIDDLQELIHLLVSSTSGVSDRVREHMIAVFVERTNQIKSKKESINESSLLWYETLSNIN